MAGGGGLWSSVALLAAVALVGSLVGMLAETYKAHGGKLSQEALRDVHRQVRGHAEGALGVFKPPVRKRRADRLGFGEPCGRYEECRSNLCVAGACACPVLAQGSGPDCAPRERAEGGWCLAPIGLVSPKDLYAAAEALNQSTGRTWPAAHVMAAITKEDMPHLTLYDGNPANQHTYLAKNTLPGLDLRWRADWSRCAVVGSSARLMPPAPQLGGHRRLAGRRGAPRGLGAEIDNHTAVIRVNNAPTGGSYAPSVGNKTTLRVQNVDTMGTVLGRGSAGDFCLIRLGPERPRRAGCEMYVLSPQYEAYSRGLWTALWGGASQMTTWGDWTSGFLALTVAMHLCGTVDVYGLGDESLNGYWQHQNFAKSTRDHPHLLESTCLESLAQLPEITVHHPYHQ